jgi:ferritin-like metal-binding protein YciE
MDDISLLEKRQDRLDAVVEKLTDIQSDLNKMIAVHEQRLNQTEKQMNTLEDVVEKRREESDVKLKDVYDTMRTEDKKILDELKNMREEASKQHSALSERFNKMEKILWTYMGGFSVVVFIITYAPHIFKFIK